MTVEDDVRQMLARRAGDVEPGPDGWNRIEERLDELPSGTHRRPSPRRLLVLVAAAAVALGGVALTLRPDQDQTNFVATGSALAGDGGDAGHGGSDSGTPAAEAATTTTIPTDASPFVAPTFPVAPAPPGAPQLLSATAVITERQGTYGQGTITVTFDRPVELSGVDTLIAMRLVVFEDDPTCANPNGNSHEVISGNGTPTLTLDASSLKAPTTYIQIVMGFVRSVESGVENTTTPCTAVPTSG